MDVLLDADETLVRDQARNFLAASCPASLVRACEATGEHPRDLWRSIVELGWLDTCLPEAAGGLGLPIRYLSLIFEEAGRHLLPAPLLGVAVSGLILAKYAPARLDEVRSGDVLPCLAIQEEDGAWSRDAVRLEGRIDGDCVVLNGTKMFVDGFAASQRCLTAFRVGGGLSLALVDTSAPGLSHVALVPTAKDGQSLVRYDNVRVPTSDIVGTIGGADAAVAEAMDLATLFATAQLVGAARKATELAIDYARQRVAFGQPIGAFQAIQHLCADMINGIDGAELLCREASWKLGEGLDAGVEISQAKAFANEKCLMAARSAQQIHGGIGFIMEFDLQLWYRRIASWSLRYGTSAEHRRRVAARLFDRGDRIRLDFYPRVELPRAGA